mmetsp:Transcript_16058/g.37220  ORF Transcript_16058/g.37220 Transcript_16058/m.37220 type:complete len:203 (+) Transcript_16058:483-1091(+)
MSRTSSGIPRSPRPALSPTPPPSSLRSQTWFEIVDWPMDRGSELTSPFRSEAIGVDSRSTLARTTAEATTYDGLFCWTVTTAGGPFAFDRLRPGFDRASEASSALRGACCNTRTLGPCPMHSRSSSRMGIGRIVDSKNSSTQEVRVLWQKSKISVGCSFRTDWRRVRKSSDKTWRASRLTLFFVFGLLFEAVPFPFPFVLVR